MLLSDLQPGGTGQVSKRGKVFTLCFVSQHNCYVRYVDSGWTAWLPSVTELYVASKEQEGRQLRSFGAFMMKLEGKAPKKKEKKGSWPKATMPGTLFTDEFYTLVDNVVHYGEWDNLIDAFTWDTHPMEDVWCEIDSGMYDNYDIALTEVIGWAIELGIILDGQAQSTFERQRLDILAEDLVPW